MGEEHDKQKTRVKAGCEETVTVALYFDYSLTMKIVARRSPEESGDLRDYTTWYPRRLNSPTYTSWRSEILFAESFQYV
jgi:hypothetical protein